MCVVCVRRLWCVGCAQTEFTEFFARTERYQRYSRNRRRAKRENVFIEFPVANRKSQTTGRSREYRVFATITCVRSHKRSKAKRTNYRTEVLPRTSPTVVEILIPVRKRSEISAKVSVRGFVFIHFESSPDSSFP